jgi:hypothetical protein
MQCKNHPGLPAKDRCAGCAELFCENCLVPVQGRHYCAACKVMAVQGRRPPVMQKTTGVCKAAKDALTCAIVGVFCFGFILGPMAIVKGANARKEIARNPRLGGEGLSYAAQALGVCVLIYSLIFFLSRIAQVGRM